MQQEGEPSVEEILESIKSVIARDNRTAAKAERQRRENNSAIGQPISAPSPAPPIADQPAPTPEASPEAEMITPEDDILDLDMIMSEMVEEELSGDETVDDGLTTQGSTTAMRESLAALAAMSVPSAPPQIVRSGETSLEGLVREMLRPMLAQWLETNLPPIVDTHVKAEIARIAGKKG